MQAIFQLIATHRVLATTLFLMVFPWLMPYEALAINMRLLLVVLLLDF